jgi:hypothetical protein
MMRSRFHSPAHPLLALCATAALAVRYWGPHRMPVPAVRGAGLDQEESRRLQDAAFGKFVVFLKARRLFDQSIIVFTDDHGDSLAEDGGWSHAYTLFPEIVIHLPPELNAKVTSDPAGPAFSADITPSLYYRLGHCPVLRNELFGVPLFTETAADRRRDVSNGYLIAASDGAVYSMLSGDGRELYVADGVNYRRCLFALGASGAESRAVSDSFRREPEGRIRDSILAIGRFYRFADSGEARHE